LVLITMLIPTTLVVVNQANTAAQAEAAAKHLTPATQVLEIIRLSQQARGQSNAFLNGNAGAAAEVKSILDVLNHAFARADNSLQAVRADPQIGDRLRTLRSQIDNLASRVQSKNFPATDSFATYSQIIEQQMALLRDIVADTGLNLDSHPDTLPLIDGLFTSLPPLTEYLGQARGMSAGLLARGSATEADRQRVAALHALSLDRQQAWESNLNAAGRSNAQIGESLASSMQTAMRSTREALDLTQQEVIT